MDIFTISITLVTAISFTAFGYIRGVVANNEKCIAYAVDETIRNLVKDGYLRTKGAGKNLSIVKIDSTDANIN